MATYTTNAGLDKAQGGQTGWGTVINRMVDKLDATKAIGGFAVRAASIDPGTGQPTGLGYTIAAGRVEGPDGMTRAVSGSGARTAPASNTTYVWLAADDTFGAASTPPVVNAVAANSAAGAYLLAKITADASRITAIEDLRDAVRVPGVPTAMKLVEANPTSTTYTATPADQWINVVAFTAPITIHLADSHSVPPGRVFWVTNDQSSSQPVTIASAASAGLLDQVLAPGTAAAYILTSEDGYSALLPPGSPRTINRRVVTASGAVVPGDEYIRVDATAGPVTLTFPFAFIVNQQPITLAKVDATANAVTLAAQPTNAAGTETFDGATTLTLATQGQKVTVLGVMPPGGGTGSGHFEVIG